MSKKGQNYKLFWNLHTLKCKEKHPRARAVREPPAPGGQGGSGGTPDRRLHPLPPVGRGAPAARQSGARAPS